MRKRKAGQPHKGWKAAAKKRLFPDAELGEPVKTFADTFSAEGVILRSFFAGLSPEQQKAALEYRGEDC